jgi:DNA-binding PadR family transcriptional regulator
MQICINGREWLARQMDAAGLPYERQDKDPRGEKEWRPLRKGIADLHRRVQVCQAANERYLDALAATDTSTSLGDLLRQVCRPTTHNGRRIRALRPWSADELPLFQAVNRGEFAINGVRNRDIQRLLFPGAPASPRERRRRSARVSHLLRILRAHGMLHKVPKSHRYQIRPKGREILTAVLAAHDASLQKLTQLAA